MSNPNEVVVPTVYMRASVGYLDQKTESKQEQLVKEFQPFIAELIQSLRDMQPGDEFVLSCGFVREQMKPKPGVLN